MKAITKISLATIFALTAANAQAVEIADINSLYVMGAVETGWSMGGTEIYKVSEGVFEGQVVLLNGDFKFNYEKDNWDAWVYSTVENAPVELGTPMPLTLENPGGDYKWLSNLKGAYNLSVDLNAGTLTVTEASAIYLIGDAAPGGWDLGKAIELKRTGAQTYTGTATLGTGDFKFVASNRNFASSIVAPKGVDLVLDTPMEACYENDNKWRSTEGGSYAFTVTLGDNPTLLVKKNDAAFIPTSVSIVGTALNASPIEVSSGVFKYCGAISSGSYMISATDGTVTKWVKVNDDEITFVNSESAATELAVAEACNVQITVNTMLMSLNVNAYSAWETLYVVGSFNGWSFEPMTQISANEFEWTGNISTADGAQELKFIGVDNFDEPEFGLHPYVSNENILDAKYCYNGGNDNKWLVDATARYTITVNTLEQTVKVSSEYWDGVDAVKANATIVKGAHGIINVIAPEATNIAVYDLAGRIVARVNGSEASIAVNRGVYVVKVGNTVKKIAL